MVFFLAHIIFYFNILLFNKYYQYINQFKDTSIISYYFYFILPIATLTILL